jgi:hypothetical protein
MCLGIAARHCEDLGTLITLLSLRSFDSEDFTIEFQSDLSGRGFSNNNLRDRTKQGANQNHCNGSVQLSPFFNLVYLCGLCSITIVCWTLSRAKRLQVDLRLESNL